MITKTTPRLLQFALMLLMVFSMALHSHGAVTVTAPTASCVNISPAAHSSLGTIVITEVNNADFANQAGVTIILTVPTNFEFQAGVGAVSYTAGRDMSAAAITVTTSTITITYTCGGTAKKDALSITGIKIRGTVGGNVGTILRTGGTANISGDNVVDGIIHANVTGDGTGITATTISAGNWSSPSVWSTGTVPQCNQHVVINHTITADMTASVNNLTISTGAQLTTSSAITVAGTFTISGTGTYVHNNTTSAATTIFAGTESISTTSTMQFDQWYNLGIPLASLVTGNFGNIIFNTAGTWQQDGYFAPSKIKGDLTVSNGTVVMDDGTGMTTALTLNNVTLSGSGNITVCSGTNRNFTFTTSNFTDNGTGSTLSSIMNGCTGVFVWNVTGNISINDNFSFLESCGSPTSGTVNVSGNFSISGGTTNLLNTTSTTFTGNITGITQISGASTSFVMANSGSGKMTFNSGSVVVSGGTHTFLTGTFSGNNQITTTGNFEVTGASTSVTLVNISAYTPTMNLDVGNDLLLTSGQLVAAYSNGPIDISATRNFTISGATAVCTLQNKASNASTTLLDVSGTMSVTSGTYTQSLGEGNVTMTIAESLILTTATFTGMNHIGGPAAGVATYNFQDLIINGGTTKFFNVKVAAPTTVTFNITNNLEISWLSNSDIVELLSYDGSKDGSLDLNIGAHFLVRGNYSSAYFVSSNGGGGETVDIGGMLSVAGGKVFFVNDNTATSVIDAHNITTNIGGDLIVTGGETFLSSRDGSATVNVSGDCQISGGTLNLKWLKGAAVLTISGNFTQSGGTFNIHSQNATASNSSQVIVNGDFTQSNGTFNFDNYVGTAIEHTLTLNGANCTLGGTGVLTHANNLTTNYAFGQIYFGRSGTTVFNRTSSTHNIQHVKLTINSGTTVNASSSTNGFQITSVASSTAATHNTLTINGTLDMGSKILTSRQNANYYSQLTLSNGGRYRTSHTGGLYSGNSGTPSSIDGFISSLNRANFTLGATSTVEYYGTTTSVVTGVPNGIASTTSHQYGNLEINFTGTAGSTWVYPETADEVTIRTSLILTAGEFNLDSDHITSGGGRPINLSTGATMSRTSGFIRSETEDGSAVVKWSITTNGARIVHFGYDASNYIPFTYDQTAGNSGIVNIGTYHTIANNTPYPPTVNHVNAVNGADNSAATVDRFWNLAVPGAATASLTFSYTATEGSGVTSPRAQRWEPVSTGWYTPTALQTNPTATSTNTPGITGFNTWWTLAAAATPLPIELISFEASKKGNQVLLNWITQSEINNDFFNIERSSNGVEFETILYKDGAGNSSSPLYYKLIDESPINGNNYYRLKQTDYDGHFTYSSIKMVDFNKNPDYKIYPVPANIGSVINIEVPYDDQYQLQITDIQGRLILNEIVNVVDRESLQINTSGIEISAGIYYLIVNCNNSSFTKKLIFR